MTQHTPTHYFAGTETGDPMIYTICDGKKVSIPLTIENILFIVRACNALEPLVAALEIAQAEIIAWRNGTNTQAGFHDLNTAKVGACFGGYPATTFALAKAKAGA